MSFLGRESDLASLVHRCQRKDSEAWRILVDRFSDFVYSVPKRYRLNDDDAADVFQSTFQALHSGIDRLDQPEGLPKWLAVTASRISLRLLRGKGKTIPLETEEANLAEVMAAEDQGAEECAMQACDAMTVRDAVKKMGGRCAPLLTMLYLDGEPSYQEISESLNIPVGAIGPTRARCLEKLRKALEDDGFFS